MKIPVELKGSQEKATYKQTILLPSPDDLISTPVNSPNIPWQIFSIRKSCEKMRYKRKFVDESIYIVSLPEDTRHFYNVVTGKSLQSSHFNNNIMQIEVQILILDSAFHLALVYDHYALYHVT